MKRAGAQVKFEFHVSCGKKNYSGEVLGQIDAPGD